MAVFYVDSSLGTRAISGGFGSFQTGTFAALGAANVYENVTDAIEVGLAATGDYILVSHLHDYTYLLTDFWSGVLRWDIAANSTPMVVMSVSSTDIEQYTKGARESADTSGIILDAQWRGVIDIYGFSFFSPDLYQANGSGSHIKMFDCLIEDLADNNWIYANSAGASIQLFDTVINYSSVTANGFQGVNGNKIVMIGGAITSTAGGDGNVDNACDAGFGSGGGTIIFIGVDLSIVDVALAGGVGGSIIQDDAVDIVFDRCEINPSVLLSEESMSSFNKTITATNSNGVDSDFRYVTFGGEVNSDLTFYRDDSSAFTQSGNKASLKIVTNTDAAAISPMTFDFSSQYYTLSDTATDTLRLYVLSATALTDEDLYFDVIYPDGVTISQPNILTSTSLTLGASLPWFNPLATLTATPVALTANTDVWTGRTTENRYQIDIDTSVAAGSDSAPIIRISCGVPSATIYVSTDIDGV